MTSKFSRPPDQIHAGGVDEQRLGADVRILARDLGEHPIPERHAEALRVRLGDRRQQALAVAAPREIEGEADHALGAVPREHRRLHRHFVRPAGVEHAADLRVLAFGVLAHDDEVDVARLLAGERTADAGVEDRRPHARVLIEAAPDRQQQAVERDVVLHPRIADRAEEDRVERPQPVERVGRHHPAVLEVVLRAPRKVLPLEAESRAALAPPPRATCGSPPAITSCPMPSPGNHRHAIRRHRCRHHKPIIFHHRKPIGSQIARCTSEITKPMRHHCACVR